jgi:sugar phosphate isomerase/epimerase
MGNLSDAMEWQFGISEVTTWPWSFDEDVARYAALGARAIEVWEFKLERDPARRIAQLRAAGNRNLRISSFQAQIHSLFPTHLSPQPHDPRDRLNAIAQLVEKVGPHIPDAAFVLNTGIAENGNVERAFERSATAYRKLARVAAASGVRLALEPLHPIAMNEDSFAWNLEDALEIVEAVDHDAFGICADAWNLAGQHDLRSRLRACRDRIFLAQVADYRRPRSFLDRLAVGDGSLNFEPFLEGLAEAGYTGPMVLEIFSKDVPDSLYEGDLHAVVSRSRETLTRLLGAPPA